MDRWQTLQPFLRETIKEDDYSTWIMPLVVVSENERSITLTSENKIVTDWVRDHFFQQIETIAQTHFGKIFSLKILHGTQSNSLEKREPPVDSDNEVLNLITNPIHPHFDFDHFVIGPSNQFASAAAEAVTDRPGESYNPLFIYGGSGLGKTHLLHAIAHRSLKLRPDSRVLYMTTEHFVNEFITSIQRKRMAVFRRTFRNVDTLLLDDIQSIGGKEQTQEEFFHTFNTLHSTGRQVVFTSDVRPAEISGLEERLRTRFMQGLIADIQPPDLETRCAILREKARAQGRDLSEDVVYFISRRIQTNVRELEGCLNRTIAFAQLKSLHITVDVVRSALFDLLPEERQTTPSDIIRFIAHHYGIRVADLKGRNSRRSIALPRQVAMYLLRKILSLSFPEIGKIFFKHHSTVMYAMDNIEKLRKSKPDFDSTLTSFSEHFNVSLD